ncbi:MAG: SDR family oxidoreductase [Archangiaceae bacterium]|nr:SDR family oxidoreductase [Archangiaceae bacterium]
MTPRRSSASRAGAGVRRATSPTPGRCAALWDAAEQQFGRVDVWSEQRRQRRRVVPVAQLPLETCSSVVATNLTGCVLGTRVALEGMLRLGGGQIFNMEGFGSNPHIKRTGMAVYGATKCAVRYFTQSVSREVKGSTVKVGTLSPGIVVTQMLVGQFDGAPAAQWSAAGASTTRSPTRWRRWRRTWPSGCSRTRRTARRSRGSARCRCWCASRHRFGVAGAVRALPPKTQ